MVAEVIVDISNSEVDKVFEYLVDFPLEVGSRVTVPFRKSFIEGYVLKLKETSEYDATKLKSIREVLDEVPVITAEMIELMQYMCDHCFLRKIDALRLFIPSHMRGGRIKQLTRNVASLNPAYENLDVDEFISKKSRAQREIVEYLRQNKEVFVSEINKTFSAAALRNLCMRDIVLQKQVKMRRTPYEEVATNVKSVELTSEQRQVVDEINSSLDTSFVLHGITGSGKTEVYMRCISETLKRGKTAIMLEPEISLTPQVFASFKARFGDSVAILHSGLSAGERFDEWCRLLSGEAKVAVGARSAIFAPLNNVGLIIIDEEHDSSYSSESNPRYLTHDIAEFRRKFNGANLVLGSATPSIETYYKAKSGIYKLLELKNRVNKRALPNIEVVNMCEEVYAGNPSSFSRKLESELHACVDAGNQAIIFINRRGYSSYLMCKSCGYVAKCEHCDVSLVYHRDENMLKCHYCGSKYWAFNKCPVCESPHVKQGYVGTQAIVERLCEMFPDKKILRMDNDTTQNKDAHVKIINEFASGNASVLVGTQMVAKGHDFANVTLVGIIDADMSLHFADFRSNERTYQLITQVSGRAGRDKKQGVVVLQTYTPYHYVYKFALKNDYKGFYEKELNLREVTKYPPFSKIVRILVTSEEEQIAGKIVRGIFDEISEYASQKRNCFSYLNLMRSPLNRLQNKYRLQVIFRIVDCYDEILRDVNKITAKYHDVKASTFLEINPNNLS